MTTITIAVCTYRRPSDLSALLPLLAHHAAQLRPQYGVDVLVVDNDADGSAAATVREFDSTLVRYVVEPRPGIASARNRALDETNQRDVLVFIDDDERPHPSWLANLVQTRERTGAAAVAGAVTSEFAGELDPWVRAGEFFHRRRLPTGTRIDVAATNNLLLDLAVVRAEVLRFDPEFGLSGGEDTLFTRALVARGHEMVWCNEAVVTDRVPSVRMTPRWVLLRAFSSGNTVPRVALRLAGSGRARVAARVDALRRGLPRLAGGLLRALLGLVLRSPRHQAKGLRTAGRGGGMILGALGFQYQEYRRPARAIPEPPIRQVL